MATKAKTKLNGNDGQSLDTLRAELSQLSHDLQALYELELKQAVKQTATEKRTPGRFKGRLIVGEQFFEPLTDEELKAFSAE